MKRKSYFLLTILLFLLVIPLSLKKFHPHFSLYFNTFPNFPVIVLIILPFLISLFAVSIQKYMEKKHGVKLPPYKIKTTSEGKAYSRYFEKENAWYIVIPTPDADMKYRKKTIEELEKIVEMARELKKNPSSIYNIQKKIKEIKEKISQVSYFSEERKRLERKEIFYSMVLSAYKDEKYLETIERVNEANKRKYNILKEHPQMNYYLSKWHELAHLLAHSILPYSLPKFGGIEETLGYSLKKENILKEALAIAYGFKGLLLGVKKGRFPLKPAQEFIKEWMEGYKVAPEDDPHRWAVEHLSGFDPFKPCEESIKYLDKKIDRIIESLKKVRS